MQDFYTDEDERVMRATGKLVDSCGVSGIHLTQVGVLMPGGGAAGDLGGSQGERSVAGCAGLDGYGALVIQSASLACALGVLITAKPEV